MDLINFIGHDKLKIQFNNIKSSRWMSGHQPYPGEEEGGQAKQARYASARENQHNFLPVCWVEVFLVKEKNHEEIGI